MYGKARDFKLHMTRSILFLMLQVCSVFYLATKTSGTLRGLFYHLFSVIYASLFFAVRFVETFERLAKTYQFLKIFTAVIQDHYFRQRHFVNPLQGNLLYCAARFANLEQILGFSVPSITLMKVGLMPITM